MEAIDPTIKPNGGMFVTTNGSSYNKIYFDLTGAYNATQGDVLTNHIKWSIL
jgi:hypothetical protein